MMRKHGPNLIGRSLAIIVTFAIFLIIVRVSGLPLLVIVAALPVLVTVLAVAVISFVLYVSWRRRRSALMRELKGLCIRCGYDLRASSNQCPECGMPILRRIHPITRREITQGVFREK